MKHSSNPANRPIVSGSVPIDFPGRAAGRRLEPEVMDDDLEVDAYLDGVATAHLDRMDDTFVDAALSLLRPPRGARQPLIVDIGTGIGAIPVKMARRRDDVIVVGVDRSRAMLSRARARARNAGLSARVRFRTADGRRLPFPARSVDLVVSNSLLHHIADPTPLLDEMDRVLRRGGVLFVRDLRRPHPRVIERHIREHGRHYRGTMLRLFSDSVRAAFTEAELRRLVAGTRLASARRARRARVRRQFETYLVIELS